MGTLYNKGGTHPTRLFHEPEELYKVFQDYKEYRKQEEEEWLKIQYVGKEGNRVTDKLKLPLTMSGFEVYCYDRYGNVGQYFENKDNLYTNFVEICSRIKKEIADNQITGGMLGMFNPSITQRLNNLVERQDVKSDDKPINSTPNIVINYTPPVEEE